MGYYKDFEIENTEGSSPVPNASKEVKNLILGLPVYGMTASGIIEENLQTEYFNTPETEKMLTDGKFASKPHYLDPAYFHFTRGVGRTVFFRLPYLSAASKAVIHLLREDDVAVYLPRRIEVLLSENGVDWQCVGKTNGIFCDEFTQKHEVTVDFGASVKAVYAAFRIETSGHVWIDEIELFGTEYVGEDALSVVPDEGDISGVGVNFVNRYPTPEDFLGVRNVLLSYNCVTPDRVGDKRHGFIDEEQYLPYVAYIKDGKIADTLFDAFLYLPYSNFTYSKLYKCAEGWRYYLDNVFAPGYNLDALDKTAARVGKELGIPDYKVTVFFSILHTKVRYGEHPDKFGDLDGDGIDEDMTTFEDRRKATKWCIDEQIARFKALDPKHCELKAFYWFEEDINYGDRYELDLIAFARDYLHSLGYKLFWIPYFEASGFQDWRENGFDIACMQPNYAFNDKVPKQRLYDNAVLTKQLGMCYEMEVGGFDAHHADKFRSYMDCGAETGFMHSVKMYYQDGVPGVFYYACKSEDPDLHALYDELYLFCNEKYVSRRDR